MRVVKNSLETARYHLQQEQQQLAKDIERETTAVVRSQKIIDKALIRLEEVALEIEDVNAAAETLKIQLGDVI